MWIDERNEFCDATAMSTAGTGTANIGDVIDSSVARDVGQGQPVYLVIQVSTAATSGGSATVQFQLVSDSGETLSTDGTQTIHMISNAIAVADLTQGWQTVMPLPMGDNDASNTTGYERYIGLQTVIGTAALTAGAVNAFLTCDPAGWKSYADATN